MSTTEILRRLLDERGVEWKAWDGTHPITVWHDETYLYEFIEYRLVNGAKQVNGCPSDNDGHCELTIKVFNCTPEQAIAATPGATDANPTQAESSGTCHMVLREDIRGYAYQDTYVCSECGEYVVRETYMGESEPPNYCPNCGRRCVG